MKCLINWHWHICEGSLAIAIFNQVLDLERLGHCCSRV